MIFKEFVSISYGDFNGKQNVHKVFFVAIIKNKELYLYGYRIKDDNGLRVTINKTIGEISDYHTLTDDPNKDLVFFEDGIYDVILSNNVIKGAPKLIECKIDIRMDNTNKEEVDIKTILNEIKEISYDMYKRISMGIVAKEKLNKSINNNFSIPESEIVSAYLLEMLMNNEKFLDELCYGDSALKELVLQAFIFKAALDVNLHNIMLSLKANKIIVKENKSNDIILLSDYMYLIRRIEAQQSTSFFMYSLNKLNEEQYKEIKITKEPKKYDIIVRDSLYQFVRVNYIELYIDGIKVFETYTLPIYQDQMFKLLSEKTSIFFQGAKLGIPSDKRLVAVDGNKELSIVAGPSIGVISFKDNDTKDKFKTKINTNFKVEAVDDRVFMLRIYNKPL
jgi:hypothetical protein